MRGRPGRLCAGAHMGKTLIFLWREVMSRVIKALKRKVLYKHSKLRGARGMIVCSCNVFSDSQVRTVLAAGEAGPRNVREVYGCLGCSPKCGRCARTIHGLMQEALGCGADARLGQEPTSAITLLDEDACASHTAGAI